MLKQDLIEKSIGYRFSDTLLLTTALTHSSYAHEEGLKYSENNERLEFLGDAVLELASSKYIFNHYPDMPEGQMTKLRAALVCEPSLADAARKLDLGSHIRLSHGEKLSGGALRDSILSDAFEALLGAVYLDGGFSFAEEIVIKFVFVDVEKKQIAFDSKSVLQELVQDKYHENTNIEYIVTDESGPAHQKSFTIECIIQGEKYGTGTGPTKKKAEGQAAYEAVLKLRSTK